MILKKFPFRHFLRGLSKLNDYLQHRRIQRHTRIALRRLSPEALKDIGLTKYDISRWK